MFPRNHVCKRVSHDFAIQMRSYTRTHSRLYFQRGSVQKKASNRVRPTRFSVPMRNLAELSYLVYAINYFSAFAIVAVVFRKIAVVLSTTTANKIRETRIAPSFLFFFLFSSLLSFSLFSSSMLGNRPSLIIVRTNVWHIYYNPLLRSLCIVRASSFFLFPFFLFFSFSVAPSFTSRRQK